MKIDCMDELVADLKEQISIQLKLKNIKPEDIDAEAPLFGEGLGLDSLDVLELIVLLKQKYNIKVSAEDGPKVFRSIKTIAEFITAKQA